MSTRKSTGNNHIFVLPVLDYYLIYAPLQDVAALVDRNAVRAISNTLQSSSGKSVPSKIAKLVNVLRAPVSIPQPRQGAFSPAFLGLIPTRNCNLDCRYCGFMSPDVSRQNMSLELAAQSVNWYMDEIQRTGQQQAEVHFFGGEPFVAEEIIDLAVHLAQRAAGQIGCTVRFEVATNATFSEERCHWVADNIDTVVLSLDGPADIQNLHRPYRGGQGTFDIVRRNARILSRGKTHLCLRACVTADTVDRMVEIATWFCQEFTPDAISFEPLQPTIWSESAGLKPPAPWTFAQNFIAAADIIETHGIEAVYAPSDIRSQQVTFCPVGRDFVIVTPDGKLNACYLLARDWQEKGMDLEFGSFADGQIRVDTTAINTIRQLNVHNKSFCQTCFAKWHCAGGCHVNHIINNAPGDYPRLCIQIRLIALRNILQAMGQQDILQKWLKSDDELQRSILQPSGNINDAVMKL